MGQRARTPAKQRLYAVGDIHGRLDLLTRLLAMIEADAVRYPDKDKKLIFVGDYVDRGVESRGVIERLTGSFGQGLLPHFLRGNHDDCFLQFLNGDLSLTGSWLQLGGIATLASYGVNPFNQAGKGDKLASLQASLDRIIPQSHRVFLENTVLSLTYGDYHFVHAGVRPGVPLDRQSPEDQMWIRDEFLTYPKGLGKMIVHGHTISPEPDIHPNRIGIDTGAFATGHLTCLIMDGTNRLYLQT